MSNVIIYDTYNVNVTIEENEVVGIQVVAGFINDVIAGTNVTIDKTDPLNPIINSVGGSMVYPGAGIALSTGSAWGTSITDNSANWNAAAARTFSNGLTEAAGAVKWNGPLTEDVDIEGLDYSITLGTNTVGSGTIPLHLKSYNIGEGFNFTLEPFAAKISYEVIGVGTGNKLDITTTTTTINQDGGSLSLDNTGLSFTLGSDATGDTYYRNSSGYFTRLPVGPNGHVLTLVAGLPSWAAAAGGGWATTGTTNLTGATTIAGTTTNTLQFDFGSLGTSYSNVFMLNNPTDAAAGLQQISPALTLRGRGWKTTATAESRTVDFIQDVTPAQGAANPTGYMSIWSSLNGAARSENVRFRNDGAIFLTGGSGFAANIFLGTSGDTYINRPTSGTNGINIYGPSATANIYTLSIAANASLNYSYTSGTGGILGLPGNFTAASGTGNFYATNTTGTINMTSTSSGNVFSYGVNQTVTSARGDYVGFYHNPNITSVLGVHYAIRANSGRVLLAGLPTSSAGLATGELWSNLGVINIV